MFLILDFELYNSVVPQITIANIGSYPRIGEEKDQQRYRRGYQHFEKKDISAHAYRDVVQSVVQEVIKEQISAGLDEVTDGLISWSDPISHFIKDVPGFTTASLTRYFDNNFYIRQPCISSKPKWKKPKIALEIDYAQSQSSKPVRAVLTGPYTLARHSISALKSFEKLQDRISLFTDLLLFEIKAIQKFPVRTIQVDEPSLATTPADFPLVKKSLETLEAAIAPAKSALHLPFGSALPLVDALEDLPFNSLHLDFTRDGQKLADRLISKPSLKNIGMGVLNVQSTAVDPLDAFVPWIQKIMDKYPGDELMLHPAGGLEFLPRNTVMAKLQDLARLKETLNGRS